MAGTEGSSEFPATVPAHPLAGGPLGPFLAGSDAVLVGRLDDRGRIVEANGALRRWLDGGAEKSAGWRQALEAIRREPSATGSWTVRPDRGESETGPFRILFWRDGRGDLWLLGLPTAEALAAGRLRQRLDRAMRALRRIARRDPLTGLANRGQADRWLRRERIRATATGRPLACVMVDLDRFKAINDTLGHLEGDRLLRHAAGILRSHAKPNGRAARFGGDEFLLLWPGREEADARSTAEALVRGLTSALGPASGASAGLAMLRPGEPPERLLARADAALVRAKQAGRGRVECMD